MDPLPSWPAPLDDPPEIVGIGNAVHRAGVERYRMAGLWCLHAYTYHAGVVIDGQVVAIRPGHLGVCPPDAELEYRFRGDSPHIYVHLRLPGRRRAATLAAMTPAPAGAERRLAEAVGWAATAPRRAAARVWDVLWSIATPSAERAPPPLVAHACARIETRLAEPLTVADIAADAGCTADHLSRLFRAHLGCGVLAYLADRRMRRARHLLRDSGMRIGAIGALVGMPDPHHFNKAVRRRLGKSPRAVREG